MSDPEKLVTLPHSPGEITYTGELAPAATMNLAASLTTDVNAIRSGNAGATATATLAAEAAFKRDASVYLSTTAPKPTPAPVSDFIDEQNERSRCNIVFERMARGTDRIDLERYLAYFGAPLLVANIQGNSAEEVKRIEGWRDMLIKHYGMRDVDGDGFLSQEEADALV